MRQQQQQKHEGLGWYLTTNRSSSRRARTPYIYQPRCGVWLILVLFRFAAEAGWRVHGISSFASRHASADHRVLWAPLPGQILRRKWNPWRAFGEAARGIVWDVVLLFFLNNQPTNLLTKWERDQQRFMMLCLWLYSLKSSSHFLSHPEHHSSLLKESTEMHERPVGRLRLSPTRVVCCNQTDRSQFSLNSTRYNHFD